MRKTAYDMRISDWSSDVCSSDLLLQETAGVGDDDGLGHAEAADPPRERLLDRRLDDRRSHDRHRDVAPVLEARALAERLRVGVGVEIGRAAWRDSVGRYVSISGVVGSLTDKITKQTPKT